MRALRHVLRAKWTNRWRVVRGLVVVVGLVANGCRCEGDPGPPTEGGAASANPPASSSARARSEVPASEGPLWDAAARLDPLDLARLARDVRAPALIDVARQVEGRREVALAALPYAPDRETALGRICRVIGGSPPERRRWLEALRRVVDSLPRDAERIDVAGARTCVPVLRWLGNVRAVAAPDKDLAANVEAALLAWLEPP